MEVVRGDLVITGSDGDDEISIDREGLADGQVRVSLNGADTILDGFDGDLVALLGGGNDRLTLTGLDVAGRLRIDGGLGDEWLVMEDVTIGRGAKIDLAAGNAESKLTGVAVGGNLLVRTRATCYPGEGTYDEHWLELYDSRVDGGVVLDGGRGGHYVDIDGTVIGGGVTCSARAGLYAGSGWDGWYDFWLGQSQVGGGVTLNYGRGYAYVWVYETTVRGSLRINSAGSRDIYADDCHGLELDDSLVGGGVRAVWGPGSVWVDFMGGEVGGSISTGACSASEEGELYGEFSYEFYGDLQVGGSVTIDSGAGETEVWLDEVDVAGSVRVTGGPGYDPWDGVWYGWYSTMVDNSTVGGDVVVRSGRGDSGAGGENTHVDGDVVHISAGGDSETWLDGCVVGGDVFIDNGGGDSYTDVEDTAVGGDVRVTDRPGRYDDDVWADYSAGFSGAEIAGSLTIEAIGGFSHDISLDGVRAGVVSVRTVGVDDAVSLDGCELSGNLGLYIPGGADSVMLNGGSTFGGSVTVVCGGGADAVTVGSVTVGRSLTIRAGAGDDNVVVEDGADIGRSLLIGGGNGSNKATVEAARVGRNLRIRSADGADEVLLAGGTEVVGSIAVHTGGGEDLVEVDACRAGKGTVLATGGDDDRVRLAEPGGSV
ncbi:MAG: hypothetical protein ACYS5V_10690, partial [Planctomycetota bacterium]